MRHPSGSSDSFETESFIDPARKMHMYVFRGQIAMDGLKGELQEAGIL